jgi:hypothetical protein
MTLVLGLTLLPASVAPAAYVLAAAPPEPVAPLSPGRGLTVYRGG